MAKNYPYFRPEGREDLVAAGVVGPGGVCHARAGSGRTWCDLRYDDVKLPDGHTSEWEQTSCEDCLTTAGMGRRLKRVREHYEKQTVDKGRYPHKCPGCGAAAYVGFAQVDCAAKCGRSGGTP